MIKKIVIPVVNLELNLYVGNSVWNKYVKEVEKNGGKFHGEDSSTPPKEGAGRTYGCWLYMDNLKDLNLLIHEVLHFLSNLYDHLHCEDEEEFKAYTGAYILVEVLKWRGKVLTNENVK